MRWIRTPAIPLPLPLALGVLVGGLAVIWAADRYGNELLALAVGLAGCLGYCELTRRYGRRHRDQIRRDPPRMDPSWAACVGVVVAVLLGWFLPLPIGGAFYFGCVVFTEGFEWIERALARRDGSPEPRLRDRPTP